MLLDASINKRVGLLHFLKEMKTLNMYGISSRETIAMYFLTLLTVMDCAMTTVLPCSKYNHLNVHGVNDLWELFRASIHFKLLLNFPSYFPLEFNTDRGLQGGGIYKASQA